MKNAHAVKLDAQTTVKMMGELFSICQAAATTALSIAKMIEAGELEKAKKEAMAMAGGIPYSLVQVINENSAPLEDVPLDVRAELQEMSQEAEASPDNSIRVKTFGVKRDSKVTVH